MSVIDVNTGVVTNQGENQSKIITQAGAAFFNTDGQMFLYGKTPNSKDQDTLFQVDVATNMITKIVTGDSVSGSDGASCVQGKDTQSEENQIKEDTILPNGGKGAPTYYTTQVCAHNERGGAQCVVMSPENDSSFLECMGLFSKSDYCLEQWVIKTGQQTCDTSEDCGASAEITMPEAPKVKDGCLYHLGKTYCPHRKSNECVMVGEKVLCQPVKQEIVTVKVCEDGNYSSAVDFRKKKNGVICGLKKLSVHVPGTGDIVEKYSNAQPTFEACDMQANQTSKTTVYDKSTRCRYKANKPLGDF